MVLWIVRILFAPNHFKLPLHTRLYYCIFGGYMVDQAALYDFKHNDKKQYLSEFDWYRSRCINDPYSEMLNNKVVFTQIIERYCKTPEIYCVKKDDRLAGLNGRVINDYDDLVKLLHEVGAYVVKPVRAGKGKGVYKYTMAISPLDCMGCAVCVGQCPVGALTMVPFEDMKAEQPLFDQVAMDEKYLKPDVISDKSVKSIQFAKPYFQFSAACAGCAETTYIKLLSQLFGDHMYAGNAAGCSSAISGGAPILPYCKDCHGHGPAWEHSLFEDNAEFAYGFFHAQDIIRKELMVHLEKLQSQGVAVDAIAAYLKDWNDSTKSRAVTDALLAAVEAAPQNDDTAYILENREYLARKSVWAIGGDGWAYDIGFGGIDHVMAQNRNVNLMVLDTEVYSNTGGQASKATPTSATAKFAAGGKQVSKKDLGGILMQYGYVYVAQVAMGADQAQTLRAFREAEAYDGPAIIIAYSHCISHGINMAKGLQQQKAWVDSGRILLYRYNPDLALQGKNPLIVEGKGPKGDLRDVLLSENRFKLLAKTNKEGFEKLLEEAQKDVWHRWNLYQSIANMGADKSAE